MSQRRSRIKPAINLAASRRSAVAASSRPKIQSGEIKPTPKPAKPLSSQHSKVTNKSELGQKENHPTVSSENTEHVNADRSVLLSTREATDGKTCDILQAEGDKRDCNRKVGNDNDPKEKSGEDVSLVEEHSENARLTVPADEQQETNSSSSSLTTEDKGDSVNAQEANKSLNPVRRKRITAVPNFGRRRLSSPVRESSSSRQKQSDVKTDSRKESKSSTNALETQEEPEKKENRKKNVAGESKRKDSTDAGTQEETARPSCPPVVQRKVLSQVFQPQGEQLQQESLSSNKKENAAVRKDAKIPEDVEKESAVCDAVDKSRKDSHQQKLPSSGNIYKKRLIEMQEVQKEETPSYKRKKYIHDPENGIDTSKMKMRDLIYYNPKENKMQQVNGSSKPVKEKYPEDEDDMEEMTSSPSSPSEVAPQVKIGPDGKIILDTQSLLKVVTPKRKLADSEMTEVKEDSSTTTYSSFRKPRHTAAWSKEDTAKFYRAISAVGTDFSMINAIFPNRKRRELKNKFKREEKLNPDSMERALREMKTFDFTDFQNTEEDISVDKSAPTATENDKNLKKNLKKKRRRKRDNEEDVYIAPKAHQVPAPIVREEEKVVSEEPAQPTLDENAVTTSTSDKEPADGCAEERRRTLENLHDPFGNVTSPTEGKSSDEEEDYDLKSILGKPTRSGRKPKQKEVFTIQESLSQPRVVRTNPKSIPIQNREMFKKQKSRLKSKNLKRLPQNPLSNKRILVSNPSTESGNSVISNSGSISPQQLSYNSALSSNGVVLLDQTIPPQQEVAHTPVRIEHYLVTYPDGRKTLIKMPVPAVAENSFDFVLNVMPSPVRDGSVLQLGVVPRLGSPSHDPSQAGGSSGAFHTTLKPHSPFHSQLPHQTAANQEVSREVGQNRVLPVDPYTESSSHEGRQSMTASEPQNRITPTSQGIQSSSFSLHDVGSPNTAESLSPGVQSQTKGVIQSGKILESNLSQSQRLRRESHQPPEGNSEVALSSVENSATRMPTEMLYVTHLVDPLPPPGSEVSDPIIAQQVDVSSSAQTDDLDNGESEAFVPI